MRYLLNNVLIITEGFIYQFFDYLTLKTLKEEYSDFLYAHHIDSIVNILPHLFFFICVYPCARVLSVLKHCDTSLLKN